MSLIITTPTGSKTFPSGSVLSVTPAYDGIGVVNKLELLLTEPGKKPYTAEVKTLGDLFSLISSPPV